MKRLLCIVSSMNQGGAETFLMKVYRQLDKTKYQMDFCVSDNNKGFYDDEIISMGGKIFNIHMKSKNPIKCFIDIKNIVKNEKYEYVLRTSQQSLAAIDLLAAKMGGANKLIYRSSNAGIVGNKLKVFINNFFSFLPKTIPNVKVAPSTEAAEFVFGKNSVKKGKVIILHNGLNYNQFKFNENVRIKIRKELNLDNKKIYGHIGRFNKQKNHNFLLDIFYEINKIEKNSVLLLIGKGECESEIKNKIRKLNLENNVKILPLQSNINEYLMAMDALIFPSFFEGMPNVIIEAQASGLQCFVSNKITHEANISKKIKYLSLDKSAKYWANIIVKSKTERYDAKKEFIKENYMVEDVSKRFIEIIFM